MIIGNKKEKLKKNYEYFRLALQQKKVIKVQL